ncbi:MAG: hypothetical protein ABGX83_08975 [Nitrospira sp.]|nr:hypothetical protein [Candidatus Manganitrophaceae bacterium]HIL34059.1 hypothetical protein [Candidatus Manganitrophaceae bacterium]
MNKIYKGIIVAGFLCSVQSIHAAPLTIPNTFTANTPTVAADVNANFTATESAVNDNNTNIGTNSTNIGTNATSIVDIEARLALLETVTDTSISLASLAGTWGMILNSAGGIIEDPGANFVEIWRETVFATLTTTATGTFTTSAFSGMDITTGVSVDGITNPGTFLQDGTITHTVATGTISGTISVGTGNTVAIALTGDIPLNGFVSQNGQMIVLEGHDTAIATDKSNVVVTLIKIQ